MRKIFFNDRYGLTQAVLDGRKTMTRRIIKGEFEKVTAYHANGEWYFLADTKDGETIVLEPKYLECEKVAVAQTYKDSGWNPDVMQSTFVRKPTVFPDLDPISTHLGWVDLPFKYHKGWTNKMFVLADLMRLYIRVTNIKVERLQDISDEDCLREGILQSVDGMDLYTFDGWVKRSKGHVLPVQIYTKNRREAFAALIDRISGRGTWERNPWVFAYEFELVK